MTNEPESTVITFKEFLENTPPGKSIKVSGIMRGDLPLSGINPRYHSAVKKTIAFAVADGPFLSPPNLKLYCYNVDCKGYRFFEPVPLGRDAESFEVLKDIINDYFIVYCCQNCKKSSKTFAIRVVATSAELTLRGGKVFKYGEFPPFGPPISPRALTLIGADRDLFLTGRRAENQGMGIGAFTYYRRVVENQKDKIFDEIIRVTNKISPDDPIIEELKQAKGETQFTKAVEEIKHGLPSSLQINGHNPLTLLHSALSEGVHDHDEKECLKLAGAIRNVLSEFSDKLAQALKEDAELDASVSQLLEAKAKKKEKESQNEN